MSSPYPGFPDEMFQFLRQLRRNNNRDWFAENKPLYREVVVKPVQDFIVAIAPGLHNISTHYIADSRGNGGSMFRIYRDTRYSKSKLPYKTNVGCQFRHEAGRDAHAPGFYVHLEPDQVFFGGGVWIPPGPVLLKIRERMALHPEEWTRLITNRTFRKRFGEVRGDRLKRPPRGFDKDLPLIEDMKLKSFFVMQQVDESFALEADFINEVEQAFKVAAPLMQFVTRALELPF